jgi:hypothetical protein
VAFALSGYWSSALSPSSAVLVLVSALMATAFLVWRWGLVGLEREKLLARLLVSQV